MKKNLINFIALFFCSQYVNAQSWSMQASNFTMAGTYAYDISIVDSNIAWAVGSDGAGSNHSIQEFTRTIDGTNWSSGSVVADTNMQFSGISATSATVAYVMMFNNTIGVGGGIYKTRDGGSNWSRLSSGTIFDAASFPDMIYFRDQFNGIAIGDPNGPGTAFFEIYQTSDSGATWNRVPSANIPLPTSGEFGPINGHAVHGTNIWFGTNKGRVYHSSDNGLHWSVATCGSVANAVTTVRFINDSIGLAVSTPLTGAASIMYKSTNGGAIWTLMAAPTGPLYNTTIKNIPGKNIFMSSEANANGRGSSYSLDGGATWVAIDTFGIGTQDGYTDMKFLDIHTGWAGGFTVSPTNDGIYKWIPGGVLSSVKPIAVTITDFGSYPNPSSGLVTLKVKLLSRTDISIKVLDMLGNTVFTSLEKNSQVLFNKTLDLRHLSKGIYMLTVESGSFRSTEKIVIQ